MIAAIITVVLVVVLAALAWHFGWICHLPEPQHWTRC